MNKTLIFCAGLLVGLCGAWASSSIENKSSSAPTSVTTDSTATVLAAAETTVEATAKEKAVACIACHGPDGNSPIGTFPILAGQTSRYLYLQLKDFKEGRRKDPMMSPIAANLSKQDMRDLADYFAAQKPLSNKFNADAAKAAEGKKIADAALCTMCHLGGFSGQNEIPRVAGQHYDYIVKQLKDFRARNRTNDAGNMTSVLKGVSDEDIEKLAHYVAGLN